MSFRSVLKSVTLNDLERRNGPITPYFTEFVVEKNYEAYLGFKIYF